MNVFQTHSKIVADYATYIRSFLKIADPAIRSVVEGELEQGKLWPEPLLQFNPAFEALDQAGGLQNLPSGGHGMIPHKGYSYPEWVARGMRFALLARKGGLPRRFALKYDHHPRGPRFFQSLIRRLIPFLLEGHFGSRGVGSHHGH